MPNSLVPFHLSSPLSKKLGARISFLLQILFFLSLIPDYFLERSLMILVAFFQQNFVMVFFFSFLSYMLFRNELSFILSYLILSYLILPYLFFSFLFFSFLFFSFLFFSSFKGPIQYFNFAASTFLCPLPSCISSSCDDPCEYGYFSFLFFSFLFFSFLFFSFLTLFSMF